VWACDTAFFNSPTSDSKKLFATISRPRIATASGDRLVDGGFQTIALLVRRGDRGHGAFPG
jgi:hypothetical protein